MLPIAIVSAVRDDYCMGESKIFLIFMAMLTGVLLSFQGCSGETFRTFGNGDPHEGIDVDNTTIVIVDDTGLTNNPGEQPDHSSGGPIGGEAHPFTTYFLCPIQTNENIEYLAFGRDSSSGDDQVKIQATGGEPKYLQWDYSKDSKTYLTFLSNEMTLNKIFFDSETLLAEVHYQIGSVVTIHKLSCKEL